VCKRRKRKEETKRDRTEPANETTQTTNKNFKKKNQKMSNEQHRPGMSVDSPMMRVVVVVRG